ncbi:NAD(P)-dependent alcohol dehydrogenase [Sphingobium sp. JS3065]|uniref:zinc-dependent alcohol dehydrogenase family protein n=1 Tax=Sphingobium sp. JS3065 TaxID=2970925 RepID=UPI002263E489|nr:NAD(P)-dependent alcohol dehydrogenase [Sphingobium sp. JS3065]UZW57081.1 NAD(P)-dependent alcohol dehydrogenase [Sphingobium sp. JS3065]
MMKSYHLKKLGGLDGLSCQDAEGKAIGSNEVRVRMRAASLNYRDLLILLDMVPGGGTIADVVPLSDGAGEVLEVGSDVRDIAIGDRVVAVMLPRWVDGPPVQAYLTDALGGSLHGTLRQEAILSGDGVLRLPDHLSFEEGAALGCASVTAWSSLVGGRGLLPGQTVLVQGTGGVSLFALQYAKAAGATVIATTSSAAKAEQLRALGADAVVNYVEQPEWAGAVRALTGGTGVDRVVEVGGPGTIQQTIAASAIGGHISIVGFSGGADGVFSPLALLGNGLTLEGIVVGSRRNFVDSLRAMDSAKLRPVLDEVFAFDRAADAYRHMLERKHVGKVIVRID